MSDLTHGDIHDFLVERGYWTTRVAEGGTRYSSTRIPEGVDSSWIGWLFSRYEARFGYPLSVIRGHTGSFGVLEAPQLVLALGEKMNRDERIRMIDLMLDVIEETHDWIDASNAIIRRYDEHRSWWKRLLR